MPLFITCRHADADGWRIARFLERWQAGGRTPSGNIYRKIYSARKPSSETQTASFALPLKNHMDKKQACFSANNRNVGETSLFLLESNLF